MDVIDLEDDNIDAEVLASMAVTQVRSTPAPSPSVLWGWTPTHTRSSTIGGLPPW
jgi:hypothetical protein